MACFLPGRTKDLSAPLYVAYGAGDTDRDSSVGIETLYGLNGPEIESRWSRDFPHPSRPSGGAHPASYTMGTGSFPEVKRPERGVDHPPPSSAEINL